MNERTRRLRQESLEAVPTISAERAVLLTGFYRENLGRWSVPVMRAKAFAHLCERKSIWIGEGELIVGERGFLDEHFVRNGPDCARFIETHTRQWLGNRLHCQSSIFASTIPNAMSAAYTQWPCAFDQCMREASSQPS